MIISTDQHFKHTHTLQLHGIPKLSVYFSHMIVEKDTTSVHQKQRLMLTNMQENRKFFSNLYITNERKKRKEI